MMKLFTKALAILPLFILLLVSSAIVSCGGEETQAEREERWKLGRLNSFENENGIGPVTKKVEVGPIDPALAERGKKLFIEKCATCHYLDMKKTGPPLRDVTKRRTAAYVMNQVQNPEQMGKLHPDGKQLVAQYMQYMTIKDITPEMARELLEFLRSEANNPALPENEQPGFGTAPPPPPEAAVKK